jgi:transcription elongation GreA/GreB family factor
MSRAFVREQDNAGPEAPPDLKISPHRNLVTRRGLRLIEEKVAELQAELAGNPSAEKLLWLRRDLRYWMARRETAELSLLDTASPAIGFGSRVTLRRDGRKAEVFEIVGEDEANPAEGKLSWVSPIAAGILGAEAGDELEVGPRQPPMLVEILKVDNAG